MITITRLLAKHIACVFPRALGLARSLAPDHPVRITAGPDGLRIRSCTPTCAVEYLDPAAIPSGELLVPLEIFRTVAGSKAESLTIERADDGATIARWQDGAIPRASQWTALTADCVHPFPAAPETFVENPPSLRDALREAFDTTDSQSARLALGCIRLGGKEGTIAATDGSQMLYQSGFQLGFEDEILVERTAAFEYSGLPVGVPMHVARSQYHVVARIGAWTFYLAIRKEGHFPRVEDHIPVATSAGTTLELNPSDREFLAANLSKLPADDGGFGVTIDLSGSVIVRSKTVNDPTPTELVLSNSHRTGGDVALAIDRRYLQRAIELEFDRLAIFGPGAPVCCRDDNRAYVWAVLGKESIAKADKDAVRIESLAGSNSPPQRKKRLRRFVPPSQPSPKPDNKAAETQPQDSHPARRKRRIGATASAGSIDQALALRTTLREVLGQTNELIRSLKRQKRQHRLMQTTLKSLKELQAAG